MSDPLQTPPEPIECPWCHSKYAPRLYGWHERTEDGRNVNTRYTVRCLNCGAQGPKKEIGPHAIDAWNRRADDADRARLVAQVEELQARVTELESAIVIDRGVFNRLCTLQAIMEHPVATPSAEEFDEYTGLLELVFHTHEKETADNE